MTFTHKIMSLFDGGTFYYFDVFKCLRLCESALNKSLQRKALSSSTKCFTACE